MNTNIDINNTLAFIGSNNQLNGLFNLEEIQRLQDLFADVNGVASLITLPDGTPITRPSKFTRFCSDIIRGTDKGCSNCYKSDQIIGRHNPAGPNIQICQSGGLWDAGSGITVGGKHIANWLIGQVRNEEVDEQHMMKQADEIGANGQEFIEAYKEVPIMSVEQFSKVSNLMFEFANNLSEKAYNNLQLKLQVAEQEKTIELLKESEENLRYIIKHDPNAIAVYDLNLHYIAVSDRYLQDYNVSEEDIIGKHHYEVFPEMPQNWKDIHQCCLAGAVESNEDDSFERPNGTITYTRWECRPWHKVNGEIGGIITYTEVITGRKKTEIALMESEERFRELYDNAKIGMYRTTPEGAILMANKALVKLLGYSSFEKLTLRNLETGSYKQSGQRDQFLEKFENNDEVNDLESIWEHQDGSKIFVRESALVIRAKDGTILYFDGVVEDITERKRAEDALLESELKYRAFFENSMDAILLTNANGKTLSANQAACSMFGYSEDELIRLGRTGVEDAADTRLLDLSAERKLKGKVKGEVTFIRKDGTRFPAEISTSLFYNHEGTESASMIIRDITDRKLSEEALQVSEERFRHSFDYAASGICLVGIDGKFLRINNAFKVMIGYDEEELKKFTFSEITHPDDISIGLTQLKRLLDGEIEYASYEKRYQRKDNRIIWIYLSVSLIRDVNHEPQYFITQTIDITERKQTENEITMLAQALKSINECVSISDLDDKILFVNESFSRTYGYDLNELIGKKIGIVRFKKNKHELNHEISKATMSGEWQGELLNKKKDGSEFPVFLSNSTIKDKDNKVLGLIGVATDITERKRDEESLLKLSKAIEQTIDTVVITNRNGKIEYVNQTFEDITGYSAKDALGNTSRILKSGKCDPALYKDLWKTILSGKVFRAEMINKKKNGDLYYVEKTISPIFDQNKTITHFVGTGVDITKRKLAEKELIEAKEKAEESDRLKSSFLANMSHEVRTPLNSIIGFSKLLADSDFEDAQKNEIIKIIIANGNHLLTIISDIMDISKLESGEIKIHMTQINARKFISSVTEQFTFQAETKKLKLKLTYPGREEETIIFADVDRLSQIFNNLISNALKFTLKGHIEIGYGPFGEMVEFYVKDTGIGIPAEYHTKIFDRFRQVETEKTRNYDGNGLGLAITKNLVELMGGKIWVESESGKGSTFYFTMPTNIRD